MLSDLYDSVFTWQSDWPPELTADWQKRVSPRVRQITEPFLLLYEKVTTAFTNHARERKWGAEEAIFVDYLMAGFFCEYLRWPSTRGTNKYLRLFHGVSRYQALEVVAHAYLHVAYDLPRVIGKAFGDVPTPNRQLLIERFLDLQDPLKDVLRVAGRDPAVMGRAAYGLRLIPGGSHFLDVFGNWVLVLRSNSFLRAEMLENRHDRTTRENDLLSRIRDAARNVIDHHANNPLAWLTSLRTWHLAASVVPFGLIAQVTNVATIDLSWQTLAVVSGGVAAVAVGYVWTVDAWLASFADDLGRAIQRASSSPGTDEGQSRQPASAHA